MKAKLLESYVNRGCKDKLELFFGVGSRIEIKQVFSLSQLKTEQVEVKVFLTDPETSMNYWPENITWLIEDSWEFVHGKGARAVVQATYDII